MKKIILGALCANLLYTNANLMAAASEGVAMWAFVLMIGFALTYSLISTYALFHVKQVFPIAVFAVLDGLAVFTHLAPHGDNFKMIVAAYFGIYTAYTLLIIYITNKDGKADADNTKVEGHDAAYWHKCFLYQKDRADNAATGNKMTPFENVEPTTEHLREVTKMIEDEPKELPDIRNEVNAEHQDADTSKTILSVKRAFARMTDPDKRRERIKDLPENIKQQIIKMYEL
ncbi:MAG: hypothetical protein J5826_01385 [Bacteroidales bacterium]|nr:hypothetical protein [Bacteroidales bacterium]